MAAHVDPTYPAKYQQAVADLYEVVASAAHGARMHGNGTMSVTNRWSLARQIINAIGWAASGAAMTVQGEREHSFDYGLRRLLEPISPSDDYKADLAEMTQQLHEMLEEVPRMLSDPACAAAAFPHAQAADGIFLPEHYDHIDEYLASTGRITTPVRQQKWFANTTIVRQAEMWALALLAARFGLEFVVQESEGDTDAESAELMTRKLRAAAALVYLICSNHTFVASRT